MEMSADVFENQEQSEKVMVQLLMPEAFLRLPGISGWPLKVRMQLFPWSKE